MTELASESDCNIGLLFSFDGAARGNPGPAASGACAWWGQFANGSFESMGALMKKGARLGANTNNFAEAHAMASALKLCLHYHCDVIEQTTASHSVHCEI